MKKSTQIKIAVMAVGIFQMGNLGISPSLASIAAEFPQIGDAAVQTLMTFPDILVIITTLSTGYLIGRIQKRYLIGAGLALYIAAGLCGWLLSSSFTILFVWAAMLGLGMGLFTPTMANVVTDSFIGDERSRVLGLQSAFVNGGGILLTVLGGLLGSVSWRVNYLVYMLAIPALICVIKFLPANTPVKTAGNKGAKKKIPYVLPAFCAIGIVFMIVYNVYPTNMSMLLAEQGFPNVEITSGFLSGTIMVGGIASALIFSPLVSRFGARLFCFAFAAEAVGLLLGLTNVLPLMFVGAFISGFGLSIAMPTGVMVMSQKLDPEIIAVCNSLFLAFFFTGGFLSAIIVTSISSLIGDAVSLRLIVGAVMSGIMILIAFPVTGKLNNYRPYSE